MRDGAGPVSIVVPLPPSYRGGTEEYAYRLAQRFASTQPVEVYTTTMRWKPDAPLLDVRDAVVHRLPAREICQRPLLLSPGYRRRLWSELGRSSVLQLHMPFPFVESPAVKAAQRAGIPTVLTYHMDADLAGARAGATSGWITQLYRTLSAHPALRAADVIVSNSWGYAQESPVLSKHLVKVHVIHKGVDVARLGLDTPKTVRRPRPASVPRLATPEGFARLLFVGRLVPYKGLTVLFNALRLLANASEKIGLLIAGKGPMELELRAQAETLGIADRVAFLGFVPDADLGPLYRFVDVVVAPSVGSLESTATALEEAAMCGTPIVGSDLPGTSETVPNDGRGGLLVPPGDPSALARAIVRMVEAGRPSAPIALRTWEDTAREYLALFRELGAELPDHARAASSEQPQPPHSTPSPWSEEWPTPAPAASRSSGVGARSSVDGRLRSLVRRFRDPPSSR